MLSVVLCYLTGFSFGFARSSSVGWITLPEYILPIASIIISTEIIRGVLAVQNAKGSGTLCYLICVCSELLAFGDIAGIMNFNLFMDFLGITVFPAVVANLLYQYLAKRYGIYPNTLNIYGGEVKAVGKKGDSPFSCGISAGRDVTVTVYGGKLWAESAGKSGIYNLRVTLKKDVNYTTGKIETSDDGITWTEYTGTGTPDDPYVRVGY